MLLLLLLAACLGLFAPTARAANDPAVATLIHAMLEGFDQGDVAAVKALHVAAPTIVDNVAPCRWSGPGAVDARIGDLARSGAAQGKTGGQAWFGDPVGQEIAGDRAYLVTPCR